MEKRVYENRNGRRRERTEKSGEGIENRRALESEKGGKPERLSEKENVQARLIVRLFGERLDDRKGEQERTSLIERKTRTKRGKSD